MDLTKNPLVKKYQQASEFHLLFISLLLFTPCFLFSFDRFASQVIFQIQQLCGVQIPVVHCHLSSFSASLVTLLLQRIRFLRKHLVINRRRRVSLLYAECAPFTHWAVCLYIFYNPIFHRSKFILKNIKSVGES